MIARGQISNGELGIRFVFTRSRYLIPEDFPAGRRRPNAVMPSSSQIKTTPIFKISMPWKEREVIVGINFSRDAG